MAVRFEVWTRPESGTFVRKFPLRGVSDWKLTLGIFGNGRVVIPSDHPRLADIHYTDPSNRANDKASIIRAFVGATHLYDFYPTRPIIDVNETGRRVGTLSGGGPGTVLDRTIVLPYDYNANPSVQPRWVYEPNNTLVKNGDFEDESANAFENADFDDGTVEPWSAISGTDTNPLDVDLATTTSEKQAGTHSLEIDPGKRHSGGWITLQGVPGEELTLDGYAKGTAGRRITAVVKVEDGMTFASTNGYIYNGWHIVELGNAVPNSPPDGLPGGSLTGVWDALGTIKVTPGAGDSDPSTVKYAVQDDHHNNTNGPIFWIDSFTATGVGVGLAPWESYLLTTMELDTTTVIAGTQSAKVAGPADCALYQEIEGMVVGVTYTATFVVYHEAGTSKDIAAQFTIPGNSSATVTNTVTVPDSTETEITVTWTATQTTGRIETKNKSGAALTWWMDSVSGGPGLAASTYGAIANDLIDDAAINHAPTRTALAWLTRTWTDALDSNLATWDDTLAFSINWGQGYRRIVTFHGDKFGYEAQIDADPTDHSDIRLHLYNPGGMGTDRTTGDGGSILPVGVVSVGPIIGRDPEATYALVEGADQWWGEDRNATLEGVWGPIETYEGSDEIMLATLAGRAGRITTGEDSETVVVKFQDPPLVPGVDYGLGDTVRLVLGDDQIRVGSYRVAAIDGKHGSPEPIWQVQYVPVTA